MSDSSCVTSRCVRVCFCEALCLIPLCVCVAVSSLFGVSLSTQRELGRRTNVPIQEFVVRNDCSCGSTIGPTISARTGVRTIDLGMPQLSMHSCREVMGSVDLTHAVHLFRGYFQWFPTIDQSLQLDDEDDED